MRHLVSGFTCLCVAASLAACAKGNNTGSAESTAESSPAAAPAPMPAALTFGDVAGKWNMRSVPESGDTTPTLYVLTAGSDSTGWKLTFQNGLTVPAHVALAGDSIVMMAGPYSSVRRKGVQVSTDGVYRREGDKLVGNTVAHYKVTTADSVLRLHTEGTRAP